MNKTIGLAILAVAVVTAFFVYTNRSPKDEEVPLAANEPLSVNESSASTTEPGVSSNTDTTGTPASGEPGSTPAEKPAETPASTNPSSAPASPVVLSPTSTISTAKPIPPVTQKPETTQPSSSNPTLGNTSAYLRSGKAPASDDAREYQHGVDFVKLPNGQHYLVWASSGNPPTGPKEADDYNWNHDIYYSPIDPSNPRITPRTLISKPEAQEPASAAISSTGAILITTEDGWDTTFEVDQRYALYNSSMQPIKGYPQSAMQGGHSAHVSASGNLFTIFLSEGWVDGGGVDNLGSGNDVYAVIVDSNGNKKQTVNVSVGGGTRDWWPLTAGSPDRAALLWQRYVDGKESTDLYISLLNPHTGSLVANQVKIASGVKYHTYSVEYVPAINRFLIMGSYAGGGGFGYLVDMNGKVTASNTSLSAIARESQSIINGSIAVQPIQGGGVAVYDLTGSSITLRKKISDSYAWQYMGTDGIFLNSNTVYIVSLSTRGLIEKLFTI